MTSWTVAMDVPRGSDGLPLEPVTGNRRVHHMARARIHGKLLQDATVLFRSERNRLGAPTATGLRILEPVIWRGRGRQLLDPDNAVAYCKPFVDALVKASWLLGDRVGQVDYRMPRQERGDVARVGFTITEG